MQVYGDTIHDLSQAVHQVNESAGDSLELRIQSRRIAVSLRKLLHEGLLNRVVQRPMFHALKTPVDVDPIISDVTLHDGVKDYSMRQEMRTLPGAQPLDVFEWRLTTAIFNLADEPTLSLNAWLNQRVVLITTETPERTQSHPAKIGDYIKYLADKEGAHSEDYLNPKPIKYADLLPFRTLGDLSHITYAHWLIYAIGLYLNNRQRHGIDNHPSGWGEYLNEGIITPIVLSGNYETKKSLSWTTPFPLKYARSKWVISSAQ